MAEATPPGYGSSAAAKATTRSGCAGSTPRHPCCGRAARSCPASASARWPSWARGPRPRSGWPSRARSPPIWPAAGLTIVSGLARGIDTAAHQGALDVGGRTVAVLGSGIDAVYPRENAALARAIARRGAVVSEFPPGTGPWKQNFPRRNRTIAGWARATIVVEAGEKSGALLTARTALEEGREVMAVPGHPTLPCCAGTNALLRDGAALVRDAADVLAELGFAAPAPARAAGAGRRARRAAARGPDRRRRARRAHRAAGARAARAALGARAVRRLRRLPGALFVRS